MGSTPACDLLPNRCPSLISGRPGCGWLQYGAVVILYREQYILAPSIEGVWVGRGGGGRGGIEDTPFLSFSLGLLTN